MYALCLILLDNSMKDNFLFCIECEDQIAFCQCLSCYDNFCSVCYEHLHKKGERRKHEFKELKQKQPETKIEVKVNKLENGHQGLESDSVSSKISPIHPRVSCLKDRAKFIPLRLTDDERRLLCVLEGALSISSYTDEVDILTYASKTATITTEIRRLCYLVVGLLTVR